MNQEIVPLVLLSIVIWPLLLAVGVAFGATRRLTLKCVPWAALPALATAAAFADTGLRLPGVLLGSALRLDGTGRAFLILNATLFLTAGLLARPWLRSDGASRFAVLLLLTMAGGFGSALAADALSFFASGTLAGYALYGLLVQAADGSARTAGRVLVVLLVVSDLMVFELLLILSQAAGSVDFTSLRQALVNTDNRGLMLGLTIIGFGIKAGLVGVHLWLAPVFVTAGPAVRPALIAFTLGAGLLGWLRLLPLGEIHWTAAGTILQWLAWVTLGYAVFVGLLQAHFRSVLAYAALALTGLWVAMLGDALLYPQAWNGMVEAVHAAILQSGFALSALLLLDRRTEGGVLAWLRYLHPSLMWLAALLLATAPMGITEALAEVDGMATAQMSWAAAAIAFLAVRGLLLIAPTLHRPRDLSTSLPLQAPSATTLPAAMSLTAAASAAAAYNLVGLTPTELWLTALMVSAAALAAWLSVERLAPLPPAIPPGDLLVPIGSGLIAALGHGRLLADTRLPLWRNKGLALVRRLRFAMDWRQVVGQFESGLNRWPTVLVVLVLLGLIATTLGARE